MRLAARCSAVILMMVGLSMACITYIVVCCHISRFIIVRSVAVLTRLGLEDYAVTADCAPYELQVVVSAEIRLETHWVMTLNALDIH